MARQPQFILRSQLNNLIRLIPHYSDISTLAFRLEPEPVTTNFQVELPIKLVCEGTTFFFELRSDRECRHFPGPGGRVEDWHFESWLRIVTQFKVWLEVIRREFLEPEPWTLLNEAKILGAEVSSAQDSETFEEQELATVREHLDVIRDFLVAQAEPTTEQLRLINEKILYLEGAATRQTKMDWANTAVGVMFTIATGLALAPDQANRLFHLTSQLVKTVLMRLMTE
jgi:hypothetical protein